MSLTKGFWGWRERIVSTAVANLVPSNYKVDFKSFSIDNNTFGVYKTSYLKEIGAITKEGVGDFYWANEQVY